MRSRGRSTIRHTLHCRTAGETIEAIDRILDPREMLSPGVQVEIEERGHRASSTRSPMPATSSWAGRLVWC